MTDRRKKLLQQLSKANETESERKMAQLVIERVCADMCDFYDKFYALEGPGAIIYAPQAGTAEDTMFYLPVSALMNASEDMQSKEMSGPADIMRKAVARAESLNVEKEALFILQDDECMSLIHYKREKPIEASLESNREL